MTSKGSDFWLWLTSPRGEYEREMNARAAERSGDKEQAALYRACLCAAEWRALGYEGSFGNYHQVGDSKLSIKDVIYNPSVVPYGEERSLFVKYYAEMSAHDIPDMEAAEPKQAAE